MRQKLFTILIGAAALAACEEAAREPENAAANAPQSAAAAENESAGSANSAAPAERPQLRLAANGLAVTGAQPGRIDFGMARADAVARVRAVLGAPTGSEDNDECPAGPMQFTSFGDLTLNFQDGRLAGWSYDAPGNPPLRSDSGIGIGTARSGLRGAEFGESTLGMEFGIGEMGGLMSDDSPSATVTNLWAGVVCQFT